MPFTAKDAFRWAAVSRIQIVQMLIAKGANVNARGPGGVTALMAAATIANTDAVRLLISKGAEIYAKAEDGSMAITCALMGTGSMYAQTVLLLRVAGAHEDSHFGQFAFVWQKAVFENQQLVQIGERRLKVPLQFPVGLLPLEGKVLVVSKQPLSIHGYRFHLYYSADQEAQLKNWLPFRKTFPYQLAHLL